METIRQLNIDMPVALVQRIKSRAIEEDRAVKVLVADAIQDYLDRQTKRTRKTRKERATLA